MTRPECAARYSWRSRGSATSSTRPNIENVPGRWVFGRLAVFSDRREGGLGSQILAASEVLAAEAGATELQLHAQCRVAPFYERAGYEAWGPIEVDEHVEHQWMGKSIS